MTNPDHRADGSAPAIVARLSTAPMMAFLAAAIALSPINLLAQGMPQLSHALLAVMVALTLTCYFAPFLVDRMIFLLGGLWLADVYVVNTTWWIITNRIDDRFIWSIAYYTFNVAIMCCVASLAAVAPERFARVTRVALSCAVTLELAVALALGGVGYRNSGTFANPNELGYWALLVATCWLAIKPRESLRVRDGCILAAVLVLCTVSGSRAAMLGAFVLAAIALVWHGFRPKMIPFAVMLAVCAALVAYATADQWLPDIRTTAAVERFAQEKRHDSFAGRGYDRLWLFPMQTLVGAGEGDYRRFAHLSQGGDNEIHSTFGNIAFSYGLVGSLLFGGMLWRIFKPAGTRYAALAVPVAVYGLAHQGLRTTELWVFLGIVMAQRWRRD